jgi:hypothetical protein
MPKKSVNGTYATVYKKISDNLNIAIIDSVKKNESVEGLLNQFLTDYKKEISLQLASADNKDKDAIVASYLTEQAIMAKKKWVNKILKNHNSGTRISVRKK